MTIKLCRKGYNGEPDPSQVIVPIGQLISSDPDWIVEVLVDPHTTTGRRTTVPKEHAEKIWLTSNPWHPKGLNKHTGKRQYVEFSCNKTNMSEAEFIEIGLKRDNRTLQEEELYRLYKIAHNFLTSSRSEFHCNQSLFGLCYKCDRALALYSGYE